MDKLANQIKPLDLSQDPEEEAISPLLQGLYENRPVKSRADSKLVVIDMVQPQFKKDTIIEEDANRCLLQVFSFDGFTISFSSASTKREAKEIIGVNKEKRAFSYDGQHQLISATDTLGNVIHKGADDLWYDKDNNLAATKVKLDLSEYPKYNFASLIIDKPDGTREVHNPSGSCVTFIDKQRISSFRTPDGRKYGFGYTGKTLNHVNLNNSVECTKISGNGIGNNQEWEIKDSSGSQHFSGKLRVISMDNASITHDYGFGTLEWLTPSGKRHRIDHNNGTTVYFREGVPEHIHYQDGKEVELDLSANLFSAKINSFTDKDGFKYTKDATSKDQWLVSKTILNADGGHKNLSTKWQGRITFEDASVSDYGFGTIILHPKQGKIKRDNQLHIPTGIPALFNYGRFLNSAGG